ncbi:autoinducer binding domain-containing protein [Mesorhizobium sp.]|uniref:autoinducer binding domain-containing protein n=1 Tax=Mesorhizobium sp. TaxID=1871066 RepID=UPI00338FAFEC
MQLLAARTSVPFFWNYELRNTHQPFPDVGSRTGGYLLDHDMPAGVTVSIHMPHGGYVTVTETLAPGATARDHAKHRRFWPAGAGLPRGRVPSLCGYGAGSGIGSTSPRGKGSVSATVQTATRRRKSCVSLAVRPNGRASLEHGGEKAGVPETAPRRQPWRSALACWASPGPLATT